MLHHNKKYFFFIAFAFLFSSFCCAQVYKITDATYYSMGNTRSSALMRVVPIDKDKTFETQQKLESYLNEIVQQVQNLRLLESVDLKYTCGEEQDNIIPVKVIITVTDSKHFLVFPKFGYDSNTGAEVKLKLKDTNFLGLLNTLNFDFNVQLKQKNELDAAEFALGSNLQYDYPFTIGITQNSWNNDFSFSWTIGDTIPEFSYTTGFTFKLPLGMHFLSFNLAQSIIENKDYETYGDDLYAIEEAAISLPLTIGMIGGTTKVTYTPSISFVYNWDKDGINIKDDDLVSPYIITSHSLLTTKVNWIGNLRDGFSVLGTQSFGWNFQSEQFIPSVSADIEYFKSFTFMGIASRIYAFSELNGTEKIGSKLRGIRDNQLYADGSYYALKVPAALVFNLDLPINIITTHWLEWGAFLFGPYDRLPSFARWFFWPAHKIFSVCDFNLQLSPFIDIALTRNRIANTIINPEDGFYSAGIEILIYPLKWKSYVIRTSIGFDVGRLLLSNYLNTTWRDMDVQSYEFYFGLGLHY